MRQFVPNIVLGSLLSILVLQADGRPTYITGPSAQEVGDRSIDVTNLCAVDSKVCVEDLAIERRAGVRPGDKTPNVPGRVPDSNGPGDGNPSDTNSGGNGLGRPDGTTGGLGERPNESGGQGFEASVKNNFNQPATEAQKSFDPTAKGSEEINIDTVVTAMKNEITQKGFQNDPFYFYSGFQNRDTAVGQVMNELAAKPELNGKRLHSMRDAKPKILADDYAKKYEGTADFGEYFWASYSKAYGRAASGTVYVVIPGGKALNQPYDNAGSNWWSFEAPELTRNPDVNEIILVKQDGGYNMDTDSFDLGDPVSIWKKGDEPFGFQADEHNKVTRPDQAFNV